MKFVIVGFGRSGCGPHGSSTARGTISLSSTPTQRRSKRAEKEGFDVYQGDGDDESLLEAAGITDADAIGALTGDLNVNFAACMIGKHHGARTVLRIDADYRAEIYEKYASEVDEIIYPEQLGAAGAKTALLGGDFDVLSAITESLSVATVDVPEGSSVIGKRVVEIELPGDARVYAHGRHGQSLSIPLPQTTVEAGDSLAVMTRPAAIDDVRQHIGA
ncbi:TrkA family potassium uptake protein [Halapricum sp. CBA1109]|uniref:potassium channel family protein n=1 Tax=Halapricum sp. CBA1109 TaxID=2668068 RepID=UPI001E40758A|nr:TrkA family potassium uptake protein [Halapricum sp. CBA1109]